MLRRPSVLITDPNPFPMFVFFRNARDSKMSMLLIPCAILFG